MQVWSTLLVELHLIAPVVLGHFAPQSGISSESPMRFPSALLGVKRVPFSVEVIRRFYKVHILVQPVSDPL